jgi:hypothetical protein
LGANISIQQSHSASLEVALFKFWVQCVFLCCHIYLSLHTKPKVNIEKYRKTLLSIFILKYLITISLDTISFIFIVFYLNFFLNLLSVFIYFLLFHWNKHTLNYRVLSTIFFLPGMYM